MTEYTGTPPTAEQLWKILIDLYAAQEGVKITYEIERKQK